jgi:hypothetical protein
VVRVLQDDYGGDAEFSSGGEPLSGTEQRQDNRCEQTNRGVSPQQRDACVAPAMRKTTRTNCPAAVRLSTTEEQGARSRIKNAPPYVAKPPTTH